MTLNKMAELFSKANSLQEYTRLYMDHISALINQLNLDAFAHAAEILDAARTTGKAIYILGNGGSAASAAHFVNDLVAGAYLEGSPPFRAFSLTDNLATLTALGNDEGYDRIFEGQLRVYMQPGDVILAMSVSGNSPNILRAVEYARDRGNTTIGMCGLDGGKLSTLCDIVLHFQTTGDEYGPVEDAFSLLGHILSGYLAMKQGKMLHH